jgi:hypothetical protein
MFVILTLGDTKTKPHFRGTEYLPRTSDMRRNVERIHAE